MSSDDRRELVRLINEWNSSRYDLFAISQPNENLEFHGVMRFYYQDAGEKVSTKCIRVDSTASTEDVINVLIEKFRPDMKTLPSANDFAIYEIHLNSERKLSKDERPLWIQLDWGKDGREGRFLLKNENHKTVKFEGESSMVKNEKKRQSKRDKKKQNNEKEKENKSNVAEDLYKECPDSNFTRSISNPEVVMARRRQQKLEQKLKQIKNRDGGGTLKVFGDTLKPDIPYKTLLMSNQDTAAFAVKETLEKYGLSNEDADNYCLVQVIQPGRDERDHGAHVKEFILDDNACPLAILMQHPPSTGSIIFQIRRCPPDILTKRRARKNEQQMKEQQQQLQQQQQQPPSQMMQHMKQPLQQQPQQQLMPIHQHPPPPSHLNRQDMKHNSTRSIPENVIIQQQQQQQQYQQNKNEVVNQLTSDDFTKYPFLINLSEDPNNPESKNPKIMVIRSEYCEIGNNLNNFVSEPPSPSNYMNINLPNIAPRHCAIKTNLTNGLITIIPYFETYLNGNLVKDESILETNDVLGFGKFAIFRFIGPIMRQLDTPKPQMSKNLSESESNMKKVGLGSTQQQGPPVPQKPQFHTIDRSTVQNRPLPANYGTLYDNDFTNLSNNNHAMSDSKLLSIKQQPPPPQRPNQANYGTLYEEELGKQQQQPTKPAKPPTNGIESMTQMVTAAPMIVQPKQHLSSTSSTLSRKKEVGLPGLIEFNDADEDALLMHISNTNQLMSQFKLAPVYTMYMMLRYRLSHKYCGNNLQFNEKLSLSLPLIHKMVNMIREAINLNHLNKTILPYWLANSSEFLYFLKQDAHLAQISFDAQELLADCVRMAFYYLINLMQQNLDFVLNAFIDPSDHVEDVNVNQINSNESESNNSLDSNVISKRPTLKNVIRVLNETMALLRGSRVNAALTIQLFSQLFHYISTWLFNKLINDNRSGLCSRYWGAKLSRRLDKIQLWAARQGLELAADCHLAKIIQAAFLLQASKHDIQDLSTISSNCFALNSLQLKCLLKNYMPAQGEPAISYQLANNLISIALNTADELLKSEGRLVQVEEEVDLKLPFLLPEDGHSCDVIKGLPAGLLDYLENLQNLGLCWLLQNRQGSGSWTEYMSQLNENNNTSANNTETINEQDEMDHHHLHQLQLQQQQQHVYDNQQQQDKHLANLIESTQNLNIATDDSLLQQQPQTVKMILYKKNGGLGLSIVAAMGQNQGNTGIYIKSVVPGGAADADGRLETGDLLLAVDDHSLVGITQEKAAEILTKSGQCVCLTIAKQAAYYHGLDALLNKSPPIPQQQQQFQSQTSSTTEPPLPPPPSVNMNNNGTSIPILYQNIPARNQPQHHMSSNNDFISHHHNQPPPTSLPPPPPLQQPQQQETFHQPPKRVQFNNIIETAIPPSVPSPPPSINSSKSSSMSLFTNRNRSGSHDTIPQRPLQFSAPQQPQQQFSTPPAMSSYQSTSTSSLNSNRVNQGSLLHERTPELPSSREPTQIMPQRHHSNNNSSIDHQSPLHHQQQQHQHSPETPQQQYSSSNNHQTRDVVMDFEYESEEVNEQQTPSVIGANEIYLDPRARIQAKKQQAKMQELQPEGEKLSFKDKMKLFAKEVGEQTPDVNNKIKVSKKQREIESKLN